MNEALTRAEIGEQIDQFVTGRLTARQLAAWAFDHFYQAEEGALIYEVGYEDLIEDVLDALMWGDSPPFVLDVTQAQGLQDRLGRG